MKQHFTASYVVGINGFCIIDETPEALAVVPDSAFYIFTENSEITRACINRIVDNLNKLAEHNAKNGGINEV